MSRKQDSPMIPLLQSRSAEQIDNEKQEDTRSKKENRWFTENLCANFPRTHILLGLFSYFVCCGGTIVRQYMPLYYKDLGFNARDIGLLESAQPFVAVFYTPFIGYIADKFSIKRYILIASLILHVLVRIGIYYIPRIRLHDYDCDVFLDTLTPHQLNCSVTSHIPCSSLEMSSIYNALDMDIVFVYLLVLNIIDRFVAAPWIPISDSYILASLDPTLKNQYGYFKGIGGIGHCCGLLFGGIMLSLATYVFRYCTFWIENTEYFSIFAISVTLFLIATPIAWWMSQDTEIKKVKSGAAFNICGMARDLCTLRYASSIAVIVWLAIVCGKMRTFDFWYIRVLNGSYLTIGIEGCISKGFYTITLFILPSLSKKVGDIPILIGGCVLTAIGCLVASTIKNVYVMIIPLIFKEIATAVYTQSRGGFIGSAVDDRYQATAQSFMTSLTYGVGKGVGALLGGNLIQSLSPTMSFYIFAAGSFGMAVFLTAVYVFEKLRKR